MNTEDPDGGVPAAAAFSEDDMPPTRPRPKELPADLPKSLNDRRAVPEFTTETEMYDAWQGASIYFPPPPSPPRCGNGPR
jgi:hypothetical protein